MGKRQKNRDLPRRERVIGKANDLPRRIEARPGTRVIRVFVEGYDDVAFWHGIFEDFKRPDLTFEIAVPPRKDLAKGKKVLLDMADKCDVNTLLCMDSDFDYLFAEKTDQSKIVNDCDYIIHTYTYATENFICYSPTLHGICTRATKNDTRIFDFELFISEYSRIIHPLFLWYAFSAKQDTKNAFTLIDFKSSVKLNYLDIDNNGLDTLEWLKRQVARRLNSLETKNPDFIDRIDEFGTRMALRGVAPENTYLFMHGHTLMDNVVMVLLNSVCGYLKDLIHERIAYSTKQGVALKNELSNFNNSQRNVRDVLLDNENYKSCFLYTKLKEDLEQIISRIEKQKP